MLKNDIKKNMKRNIDVQCNFDKCPSFTSHVTNDFCRISAFCA